MGKLHKIFKIKVKFFSSFDKSKLENSKINYIPNNHLDIVYSKYELNDLKNRIDKSNLAIFSDFDATLSKKFDNNGKECSSSVSMLNKSSLISSKFKMQNFELTEMYEKYLHDKSYDFEIRKKNIETWFSKVLNNFKDENTNLSTLQTIINEDESIFFRPGSDIFIQMCCEYNIPFIVVSAGFKTIIELMMKRNFPEEIKYLESKNIFKVIGNELRYNKEGYPFEVSRLKTIFSKNYEIKKIFEEEEKLQSKKQFIMIGDNEADSNALDFIEGTKILLGFGNFSQINIHSNMKYKVFRELFNVTVINDGTFKPFIELIK